MTITCTFEEANSYAARYRNTWRGGPTVDVLRDEFLEMHPGTLGTTIIRLARETDNPPSVAALWRMYRTLQTPGNEPLPEPDCTRCDGDGWTTVEYTIRDRPYRGCVPCGSCETGRRNSRVYESVRTASAKLHAHIQHDTGAEPAPITAVVNLFEDDAT